jgi:hypothetical protein
VPSYIRFRTVFTRSFRRAATSATVTYSSGVDRRDMPTWDTYADRTRVPTRKAHGERRAIGFAYAVQPRAVLTTDARCRAPRNVVDLTPHDLRRTVATFLTSGLGVSRLVVSKLLTPVETGVTKVYDRASYDREKVAALNAWAARLEAIVNGEATTAKVIPLARA